MMPDLLDIDPACVVCMRITAALRRLQANLPEHPAVSRVEHLTAVHAPNGEHGAGCSIISDFEKLAHLPTLAAANIQFQQTDAAHVVASVGAEMGLPSGDFNILTNVETLRRVINCAWSSAAPCGAAGAAG